MSLVLDSSVTLAWIYTEETTSEIREILNQVTITAHGCQRCGG